MEENDDPGSNKSTAPVLHNTAPQKSLRAVMIEENDDPRTNTSSAWQTGDDGAGRLSGKRASREAATGAN